MQILIREFKAEDLSFVFDSWMKSWRTSRYAGVVPNHLYYPTQRVLIEDLIARGAKIVVAYPSEAQPDVILGWACGEEKDGVAVLHYLYVKDPFLRMGIDELLIAALPGSKPGFLTHYLKDYRNWKHVPEIARRKSL